MKKIIGIIIADPNEINFIKEFNFIKSYKKNNFKVDYFKFKEYDIYIANSHIGITNAAIVSQHLIDIYKVNQIWNYGAVGATNKLKYHQVVIPAKFYYFDVITPWYKRGQIPNEEEYYINAIKDTDRFNLASGQSFINNLNDVEIIKKDIDVDLFDMEACAIAQTCKKNNINFYCVKAISDIIGFSKINLDEINNSISISSKKALDKMIELLIEELE